MSTVFSGKLFCEGQFSPEPLKSYLPGDCSAMCLCLDLRLARWTQLFTNPLNWVFVFISCFFNLFILLIVLYDHFRAGTSRPLLLQKPSLVTDYLPHEFCEKCVPLTDENMSHGLGPSCLPGLVRLHPGTDPVLSWHHTTENSVAGLIYPDH